MENFLIFDFFNIFSSSECELKDMEFGITNFDKLVLS